MPLDLGMNNKLEVPILIKGRGASEKIGPLIDW